MSACAICGHGEHSHAIDIVTGIEKFGGGWGATAQDPQLSACPFCGHPATIWQSRRADDVPFVFRVECDNTSCGVKTPQHYKSHDTARAAWNRRS